MRESGIIRQQADFCVSQPKVKWAGKECTLSHNLAGNERVFVKAIGGANPVVAVGNGHLAQVIPFHPKTSSRRVNSPPLRNRKGQRTRRRACVRVIRTFAFRKWRLAPGERVVLNPLRLSGADVAELADALDSKSGTLTSVWVRPPPSAPNFSDRVHAPGRRPAEGGCTTWCGAGLRVR